MKKLPNTGLTSKMVNDSNLPLINIQGLDLDQAIRASLKAASNALINAHNLTNFNLEDVTTKTHPELAFAKFAMLGLLRTNTSFGSQFILDAFSLSQNVRSPRAGFDSFLGSIDKGKLQYKKSFGAFFRKGAGLFLISLHCTRAITLPLTFNWPVSKGSETSVALERAVCAPSEIISFIRRIETTPGKTQLPEFARLEKIKRTEWFSTYATKVVLACGWHAPEEMHLDHLIQVYLGENTVEGGEMRGVSVFGTLIEIVASRYGSRLHSSLLEPFAWKEAANLLRSNNKATLQARRLYTAAAALPVTAESEQGSAILTLQGSLTKDSSQHFSNLAACRPAICHPRRLKFALDSRLFEPETTEKLNK